MTTKFKIKHFIFLLLFLITGCSERFVSNHPSSDADPDCFEKGGVLICDWDDSVTKS